MARLPAIASDQAESRAFVGIVGAEVVDVDGVGKVGAQKIKKQ